MASKHVGSMNAAWREPAERTNQFDFARVSSPMRSGFKAAVEWAGIDRCHGHPTSAGSGDRVLCAAATAPPRTDRPEPAASRGHGWARVGGPFKTASLVPTTECRAAAGAYPGAAGVKSPMTDLDLTDIMRTAGSTREFRTDPVATTSSIAYSTMFALRRAAAIARDGE